MTMASEVRLIDANAAMLNTHKEPYWTESEAATVRNFLAHQTTIDPESLRPKGRWIHDWNNQYGCDQCGERETMSPRKPKRYCPNCGADMREG